MIGRRIPVVNLTDDPVLVLKQAGDYYGPVMGFSGSSPAVFFLLPIVEVRFAHVQSPPHVFSEEADGSLSIRESILSKWSDGVGKKSWHGFLTRGVWSEC
jgi:hypothetical protein